MTILLDQLVMNSLFRKHQNTKTQKVEELTSIVKMNVAKTGFPEKKDVQNMVQELNEELF